MTVTQIHLDAYGNRLRLTVAELLEQPAFILEYEDNVQAGAARYQAGVWHNRGLFPAHWNLDKLPALVLAAVLAAQLAPEGV